MIYTMILARVLNAHHITDTLHHADCLVITRLVGTYRADFIVRNHSACAAVFYIVAQMVNGSCEMMYVLGRLLQQMKRQTECAAPPYSRERAYCVYSLLKKF